LERTGDLTQNHFRAVRARYAAKVSVGKCGGSIRAGSAIEAPPALLGHVE
jgi:hypothetical protein